MATSIMNAARLTAELNDLLALDHDALAAYDIAIDGLKNPEYAAQIRRFRQDHERHITELGPLIRAHGGIPIEMPHLPTGMFKLAVQQAGKLGGDKGLLLAFKANERQGRDDYRRAAERARDHGDARVTDVLERAARDESTHYHWVLETLEELGAGADTPVGRAERVVESGNVAMADAVEGVGKGALAAGDALRRVVKQQPMGAALVALGIGLVAAAVVRGRRG